MMRVREFAAKVPAKESMADVMPDFVRTVTIDAAKDYAAIDYPGQRVVKVEFTKIEGPFPKWDPETGDLTDNVDWVGQS